jgi:cob(I)alamin adenosyltransferase
MILLFTGDGKGKTTAALGQAMRVLGNGQSTLVIQFIKGPWISGEDKFIKKFKFSKSRFQIRKIGLGFVGILGDHLPLQEHKEAARKALDLFIKEKKSGKWHLIVLDEVNVAVALGLLSVRKVVAAIKNYPQNRLLILTGRQAPKELIALADVVTEMKEVKHPFRSGGKARFTVEF